MKKISQLILFASLLYSVQFLGNNRFQTDSIKEDKPFFKASTIFNPLLDQMGYHNYRIPSLLSTQKGTL